MSASLPPPGVAPNRLENRHVRVRGWVEERNGPRIEASGPEQIEIARAELTTREWPSTAHRCDRRRPGSAAQREHSRQPRDRGPDAWRAAVRCCSGRCPKPPPSIAAPAPQAKRQMPAASRARAPAHPGRLQRHLRGCQARSAAQPDGRQARRRFRAAGHAAIDVTILNSPSVNAFALPSGQLYVTRGLIALANDTSELASVLSHEMSHVIAQHAAMREDQAKQAALVDRVVNDVLSDPETGALALAKSKIRLASFSRAQEFEADGIGVGIAARAGLRSVRRRRGSSPRWDATPSCKPTPARRASIRARPISSRPIRQRRSASRTRRSNARQFSAAGRRRARPGGLSSRHRRHGLWRRPERRLRARPPLPASQARLHLPGAGRICLSTTPRRRCSASRKAAARRCGSTSCACRPSRRSRTISRPAGSRTSTPRASMRSTINGLPTATATAKGDQWVVSALRGAVRQRRLSLHLRHQAH